MVDLDQVCALQKREEVDDGYGNKRGQFVEIFREWGGFKFLRGGEAVTEARLASKQPAILTMRSTAHTRQIQPHWRVVSGGREYEVKETPRLTGDCMRVEVLVEAVLVGG